MNLLSLKIFLKIEQLYRLYSHIGIFSKDILYCICMSCTFIYFLNYLYNIFFCFYKNNEPTITQIFDDWNLFYSPRCNTKYGRLYIYSCICQYNYFFNLYGFRITYHIIFSIYFNTIYVRFF